MFELNMKRYLFSRYSRAALVVLALLLVLTGCWPFSDSSPSKPPSASTPRANSTPGDSGQGDNGSPGGGTSAGASGALNIAGDTNDPPSLDPALATDSYSLFVIRQLFGGLVAYDNNLKIVPDIAAAMPSVSGDGKTYTFTLRKGVRFADGKDMTAQDFKYSMERATDAKLAGSQPASSLPAALFLGDIVGVHDKLDGKATEISGVQAPNTSTLVINIDAPKAYFLSKLTAGPAFVVEQSNVESGAKWVENPHGTGPFKIDKWVHNQEIVLVPNSAYSGGASQLPGVNIWMGANAQGGLQQYETGGLDVTDVPVDDVDRVSDRNDPMSAELQTVPDLSVTYLAFNLRQKPFDDPKIRQALSLVIDRQKVARVMFQSRVRQAQGFVPPDMGGYKSQAAGETYNLTLARQLIQQSTYKNVASLPRLRLYTSGDALGPMLKDVFSQTLGIDLEVHEVEWSDFLDGLDSHSYPMFTLSWGADYPDPESFLGTLFRSSSPENHTGYRNPVIDDLLNRAAVETDNTKRLAMYSDMESRILKDYPAVPLYHSVRYVLVKPYVKNFKVTPMGILSLKDVRLAGQK